MTFVITEPCISTHDGVDEEKFVESGLYSRAIDKEGANKEVEGLESVLSMKLFINLRKRYYELLGSADVLVSKLQMHL